MSELLRYIINGLCATAVHYSALWLNLKVIGIPSAGVANFIAAMFGIAASFIGNRCFVFHHGAQSAWGPQAARFILLYGVIAVLHGLVMWVWADHFGQDYRIGFLLATVMQFCLSYVGNKIMVFRK